MVKSLRFFAHSFKWLVLLGLLAFIGTGLWLHGEERSLNFAKPWVERVVNSTGAPFTIGIGDISIKWRSATEFGKLKISSVIISRRDGNVFAQLPELRATIDPLGFLPSRRLLNKVILNGPRMFLTRNHEGVTQLGIEGAAEPMPISDLVDFLGHGSDDSAMEPPRLPFHDFIIEDARLTFTDELSETNIVSEAFDVRLTRRHGSYDAVLAMPFTVDAVPVMLAAGLRTLENREHVLAVKMEQVPARLVCMFSACPQGVAADGALNGSLAVGFSPEMALKAFRAEVSTKKALLTLPEYFVDPLKLGASSLVMEGDWEKNKFRLISAKLQLEDTLLSAAGEANKGSEGWYVKADGGITKLDITTLYKYWPLTMAPDSRTWITNKLKSGHAASATLKLNMTPADFAAEYYSDKSVDAVVDAREITFEYLPGFPHAVKMNGIAHFTGTTVKVEGGGASLLSGTKISNAVLWCPELHSVKNPMEATLELSAPASDVVTMLALKHFPFDDHLTLDAENIKGSVEAAMKLKFFAFSENPNSKPDEIHLDAVDYDITAKMKDIAQKGIMGGYDVRQLNGTLKADTNKLSLDGSLMLGESTLNDVSLSQKYGDALNLSVKGRTDSKGAPVNDFKLSYGSGDVPKIDLTGKRLDASVSYGNSENSLLADFPAMDFTIALDELLLAKEASFSNVNGKLFCTAQRCDTANITAKAGKGEVKATIGQENGKRQLNMTTSDAGAMLKALDITDRMSGGSFQMKGTYNESKNPPVMNGRMIISDFTLKNSQILGRIFSIGSLTGLANMLTGSGIAFEKLSANLTSNAGLITVDKGAAQGASMGITVGGTVDTRNTKLNLKGVVAPAYALNSVLGKIPLIGAIAGGEEGLIAFNYSVTGTYADPDVGVNPLSGFTPGFLRGIFSGFSGGEGENNEVDQKGDIKTPGAARRP